MATPFIRDGPYLSANRVTNLAHADLTVCSLCHGLLWNPIACQSCEIPFCKTCIKAWKLEKGEAAVCPRCPQTFIERPCPRANNGVLSTFEVICKYEDYGCSAIVPYTNLKTHEESCDYRPKTCSGCSKQIISMNFGEHYRTCEWVLESCDQCKVEFQRRVKHEHTETACLNIRLVRMQEQMTQQEQSYKERFSRLEDQINILRETMEALVST